MKISVSVLKVLALLFLVICISTTDSFARTPISSIDMTYELDSQKLHLEINKVTRDLKDDYVRKVVIFKNGQEVSTKYYNKQTNAKAHIVDILLDAKEGDELKAKAWGSQGGTKEAIIKVEKEEVETEEK